MTTEKKIEAEIKAYEKNLPEYEVGQNRWRHGYVEGLRIALRWLKEEAAKKTASK